MRWLLIVSCLAAACGGSPTGPSESFVPNYAGAWSGSYTITGCTQSGGVALANICGQLGANAPYQLNFSQNGRLVNGSFTLGQIAFPQTGGTVAPDGSLALTATSQASSGVTVVVSWNLRLVADQLTGTIAQTWTSTTLSGSAIVAGTVSSASR